MVGLRAFEKRTYHNHNLENFMVPQSSFTTMGQGGVDEVNFAIIIRIYHYFLRVIGCYNGENEW